MKQKTYVGIDIAKEKFDVFINTDQRIAQFVNRPGFLGECLVLYLIQFGLACCT